MDCQEFASEFTKELDRKNKLRELLNDLVEQERRRWKRKGKRRVKGLYERMFRGAAAVRKVWPNHAELERPNGVVLRQFEINPQIASLLKANDHLQMTAGMRAGVWRIIAIEAMSAPMEGLTPLASHNELRTPI